ncbi:MAG TPA: rRNA maturation RNase YbeY [Anaerolineales bacterium]|nr:rRNA maturation RNase YbeY [Anaerolineales bacterium]
MITIDSKEGLQPFVHQNLLNQAVNTVFEHLAIVDELDVTVYLTDNEEIMELNAEWMGIEAPTDVLSFPSEEMNMDTGNQYLGDIVISTQKALEQAEINGHPLEDECRLLVVHGMLHLFGFDHSTEDEKAEMWKVQKQVLTKLRIDNIKISE